MRNIKAIEKDIEIADKAHKAATSDRDKKEMKEMLEELELELKEAKEKGDKPKPKPAAAPKKKEEKKKPAEPAKKEAPAKKEEKAEEKKKDKETFVVAGKEYDADNCRDLILALKARKSQAKKNAKAFKTKKPVVKATDDASAMVSHIADAIPDKKIEENPKQVIAVLKEFKTKMESAFNVLGKIISATDLALLKKSMKEIDTIVAKYAK